MPPIRRLLNAGAVWAYSLGDLQDVRNRYTIAGTPTIVGSPYGNVMRFDGTNDYVTLGSEEEYRLRFDSGAQDFSVVTWVRRAVTGAVHVIFDKRDGANDGGVFYIDASQFLIYRLNATSISSAAVMTDALWHCVAVVIDRSGNGQIYVDGVTSGAAVAIGGAAMATTVLPRIGANSYSAATPFNGDIYAVAVFDRILTPAEVLDFATNKAFDY